jgi:hypothetical protein
VITKQGLAEAQRLYVSTYSRHITKSEFAAAWKKQR